jgi:hypothetical protein
MALAQASRRGPLQVPTHLRPCLVHAADEAARLGLDPQRRTVALRHAQISAIAIKPDELFGPLRETRMVAARDTHIVGQLRKATRSARQTLGDDRQGCTLAEAAPAPGPLSLAESAFSFKTETQARAMSRVHRAHPHEHTLTSTPSRAQHAPKLSFTAQPPPKR